MTALQTIASVRQRKSQSSVSAWFERSVPALVLSPSVCVSVIFVYGFVLVTGYLSFTPSTLMPRYALVGLDRYRDLFSNDVWWESVNNLAWFTAQIVAGTAWQWLFNPTYGLERAVQNFGWSSFRFNWLGNPDLAIFCVVIAAIWQCTGFVASLFLAGLRSVDDEIVKAAQIDGASLPTIYRRIILPVIRPVFFSVTLILAHLAIKTFDIIVVMTAGGPGTATWLPSYFMYTFAFERGRMGIGAASAMMMLAMIVAVLVPLMYLESRATRNAT